MAGAGAAATAWGDMMVDADEASAALAAALRRGAEERMAHLVREAGPNVVEAAVIRQVWERHAKKLLGEQVASLSGGAELPAEWMRWTDMTVELLQSRYLGAVVGRPATAGGGASAAGAGTRVLSLEAQLRGVTLPPFDENGRMPLEERVRSYSKTLRIALHNRLAVATPFAYHRQITAFVKAAGGEEATFKDMRWEAQLDLLDRLSTPLASMLADLPPVTYKKLGEAAVAVAAFATEVKRIIGAHAATTQSEVAQALAYDIVLSRLPLTLVESATALMSVGTEAKGSFRNLARVKRVLDAAQRLAEEAVAAPTDETLGAIGGSISFHNLRHGPQVGVAGDGSRLETVYGKGGGRGGGPPLAAAEAHARTLAVAGAGGARGGDVASSAGGTEDGSWTQVGPRGFNPHSAAAAARSPGPPFSAPSRGAHAPTGGARGGAGAGAGASPGGWRGGSRGGGLPPRGPPGGATGGQYGGR